MILCVDPGKHECGIAVFAGQRLMRAALVKTAWGPATPSGVCSRAYVEKMQVYSRGRKKVDPDDLIEVSNAGGRVAANCAEVILQQPREWKGQVPKKIMHERMWGILSPAEAAVLKALACPPGKRHNVYDAVCIGLKNLGRM